jgi:hypothetical protein
MKAREDRVIRGKALTAVACLGSSVGDSRIAKADLYFELQSKVALKYKV